MVIVDSTVWIDFLPGSDNPQVDWLVREMKRRRFGLTDLILCEVLQGIRDPAFFREIRDEFLRRFEVFDTGGAEMAVAAGQNYRTLRQRGHTVRKTIDCLIATFCSRTGHALLHCDRDFDAFETALGLRVVRV